MIGRGVGTVDSAAHNFPAIASPSGWAVWSPVIASYTDPVRSTCLASDFAKDADAKQYVTSWLQTHDSDFFNAVIKASVARCNKSSNVNGGYVEV